MIIAIDAGNTRSKWKAWHGVTVLGQGAFAHDQGVPQIVQHLLQRQGEHQVWIASVANPSLTAQLQSMFHGCQVVIVKSTRQCLGVTNRYAEPEKLGVDRWLAMIEAWHCGGGKACCVIDVGTAATLDVVDGNGCHAGGFIVPGISLMKESLGRSTERVHFADSAELSVDYGIDTTSAVQNGVHAMMAGWLNHEIKRFQQSFSNGAVYVTGGDSRLLLPLLTPDDIRHCPDLVLDALMRMSRA